jgi:hypothetical protein
MSDVPSYANVAAGNAATYYRIPSFAKATVGFDVVQGLPTGFGAGTDGSPKEPAYAIYASDAFVTKDAILNQERFYVVRAIMHSVKTFVISNSKSAPLIVFVGYRVIAVEDHSKIDIEFLSQGSSNSVIQPSSDLQALLATEKFIAVQTLSGTGAGWSKELADVLASKVCTSKFANFSILAVSPKTTEYVGGVLKRAMRDGHITAINRDTITQNLHPGRVVQFVFSSPEDCIKGLHNVRVHEKVTGMHIKGKNGLRVVVQSMSAGLFQELVDLSPDAKEIFTEDGTYRHRRLQSKTMVLVKRIDNNIITHEVAEVLTKMIGLTKTIEKQGVLFGQTSRCQELHGSLLANVFAITWLAAPKESLKIVKKVGGESEEEDVGLKAASHPAQAEEAPPAV